VLDSHLRVVSASSSFMKTFEISKEETEGRFVYDLFDRQWDIPELRKVLEEILPANTFFENFKVDIEFPQIGKRTMLMNARKVISENISRPMILLAMEDITPQHQN
jgi:two-component system CheB/CheR fusion protein